MSMKIWTNESPPLLKADDTRNDTEFYKQYKNCSDIPGFGSKDLPHIRYSKSRAAEHPNRFGKQLTWATRCPVSSSNLDQQREIIRFLIARTMVSSHLKCFCPFGNRSW